MKSISRRQFSKAISAISTGFVFPQCSKSDRLISATSTAFGTTIGISMAAPKMLLDLAFSEVARLENIFTLFDPASPLRQLNDYGFLNEPPEELIAVLRLAYRVHQLTGGAFDPTVQPLWELYETHFAKNPADQLGPSPTAIEKARGNIGWQKVVYDSSQIRFREPGVKLTLNGIAPGFVADTIADLLRDESVEHALINCGEFRAIGVQPNGSPWSVEIRGPEDEHILGNVNLEGNAVATSAGYATAFDLAERFHHLFNPGSQGFAPARRVVSVEAPSAGLADALATAGGVMDWTDFTECVKVTPDVRVTQFDAS